MSRRMIPQKDQHYAVLTTTNALTLVGGGDITSIDLFLFGTSGGFAKAKIENNE